MLGLNTFPQVVPPKTLGDVNTLPVGLSQVVTAVCESLHRRFFLPSAVDDSNIQLNCFRNITHFWFSSMVFKQLLFPVGSLNFWTNNTLITRVWNLPHPSSGYVDPWFWYIYRYMNGWFFMANVGTWNLKHLLINGWLSIGWFSPNLYIGNGWKSPFLSI